MDPTTRARLNAAKLKALAASAGATGLTPLGFPGGAAASGEGSLWVLTESGGLGGPLAVALKGDAPARLVVITDDAATARLIARQATYFSSPATIEVYSVDGTSLIPAIGMRFVPAEGTNRIPIDVPEGVDVVVEDGVTRFEVKGLEIGRVEDGEVAVGVGKHDREAHRMANSAATLEDLAARVHAGRRADAPSSPMTNLVRERWLRWIATRHPELVGVGPLTPVAPPTPRADLRDAGIAPALGDGVVVAFSVGVDPDLVPSAADARGRYAADADLVLVVPEADALPNTYRLAAALKRPARVVTVPNNWPALGD
ncbi:MAG TPA: hypothetical protein VHD87_16135 [Acidimicrobiales bacterium]|nr:hypothetical protein [Acidimicrobiales bacterium]